MSAEINECVHCRGRGCELCGGDHWNRVDISLPRQVATNVPTQKQSSLKEAMAQFFCDIEGLGYYQGTDLSNRLDSHLRGKGFDINSVFSKHA